MNLCARQKQRHRHRNKCMDTKQGNESGVNWETGLIYNVKAM